LLQKRDLLLTKTDQRNPVLSIRAESYEYENSKSVGSFAGREYSDARRVGGGIARMSIRAFLMDRKQWIWPYIRMGVLRNIVRLGCSQLLAHHLLFGSAMLNRAYHQVREELAEVGLLDEWGFLDETGLEVTVLASTGEAGHVFDGSPPGMLKGLGFKGDTIYLPSEKLGIA